MASILKIKIHDMTNIKYISYITYDCILNIKIILTNFNQV